MLAKNHTTETLVSLLERVAQKDQAAFSELYQATHRKLFGIVLRILSKQALAEDILQEVYLTVWQKAPAFNSEVASPVTWLATIARNRAIDEIRKTQLPEQESDVDFDLILDDKMRPEEATSQRKELQKLETCLQGLESPKAEMIKAAYLNGESREQLSRRFNQPLGTIKTWLHRSIKQLQGCMK
ncbi:sigma-70 family RNA polymerase sigma factor [Marinomonas aquiplantarum]|uniref:RNA polymerase sigma factor n=1 Tax=Marinomonas aquiplantarum TaxID=491951 RepID=A0A366D4J9_9GAMM|nr:sigma-70 family RNA polymerase sigma factor [Marinomonas aquiplantarum]RBO84960.1 RNA polymerase sigma-70 factor (ECF subfamily) [Marinomonas aquiplantarum]